MESLVAAYLVAGAAVGGYLAWLAMQQRRLTQRLRELQAPIEKPALQPYRKASAA